MKQLTVAITANEKIGSCFCIMKLASTYLAKNASPGQFIEIRCTKGIDPLLRRPLGVHRVTKSGIEVLYEVVGKGTALLAEKRAGEKLDIIGPLGNGFDLERASDINILVAGGIGVAPLVALAERLVERHAKRVHVLIGARTKSHVMCEREFKALGCAVKVVTDDGSKGKQALVTEPFKALMEKSGLASYLPGFRRVAVYACGPSPMLKAVSRIAHAHRVVCQLSFEERMACGVGVCLGCPVKVAGGEYKMVCKDGPVFDSTEIAW